MQNLLLLDVTPWSSGVETEGEFDGLIKGNTRIPSSKSAVLRRFKAQINVTFRFEDKVTWNKNPMFVTNDKGRLT